MYKIFISHKNDKDNGGKSNDAARMLWSYLNDRFGEDTAFLDIEKLPKGNPWDVEIYEAIESSDVLIVIALPNTVSNWVIREISYAQSRGISVLPVMISQAVEKETLDALDQLTIKGLEAIKAYSEGKADIKYIEVERAIPRLAEQTRENQRRIVNRIQNRWSEQDDRNPLMQVSEPLEAVYSTYRYEVQPASYHPTRMHLAWGNIADFSNVDVIVNSENIYMQMQRIFAADSVSKSIRINGSHISGNDIMEDSIQLELNEKIKAQYSKIPVPLGTVLVTSSGHEQGELKQRGIKYVFHVAIVAADFNEQFAVKDVKIVKRSVRNCLNETQNYVADISSIAFPVLATGNAGLNYEDSAKTMLSAFKDFLKDRPNTALTDIHLTAYTKGQLDILSKIFDRDDKLRKV
ncbi:MAG: TIR domain-containing protein [Anaerolineae bacterium]|nr:TIR domain-containing protein [Anaerolineae bacterium]